MSFDYEQARHNERDAFHRQHARTESGRIDFMHTVDRCLTWLKSRPAESWAFFAAGLVLAGLFM